MKIKKLSKTTYEIEIKDDLIYVSKEKNPNTRDLYIYFIDIFSSVGENEVQWGENFDDFDNVVDYIQDNFNIPDKIINQIKL